MSALGNWVMGLISLLLSAVLFYLGLSNPAHLATLDRTVLDEAGSNSVQVEERVRMLVDYGQSGPAKILAEWSGDEDARWAVDVLEEQYPHYRRSGGPAPYYEQFLKLVGSEAYVPGAQSNVMATLMNREARAKLTAMLQQSSITAVSKILATKEMKGLVKFHPVNTPAGAPLEASILASALLIQGGHLSEGLVEELLDTARLAMAGNTAAVGAMEDFYMAILGSGYRLNWMQLAVWTKSCPDLLSFVQTVGIIKKNPEKLPLIYSAIMVSRDAPSVARYLLRFPGGHGFEDIDYALRAGTAALNTLLDSRRPIYRPVVHWLDVAPMYWQSSLAENSPNWALILKIACLFGSAYFLIRTCVRLASAQHNEGNIATFALSDLGYSLLALIMATVLLSLLEPPVQAAQQSQANFGVNIQFASTLNAFSNDSMNNITADTTTLVVMLVFFLVQLFLYFLCLMKINGIRQAMAEPSLKLRLLENEDNLFDAGLYVGLGGTVASLILLAMDIVSASLIAAYASTLFGIIFVAVLKIFHVRPFRRSLLLETN